MKREREKQERYPAHFDGILNTMKYLGYIVYDKDGGIREPVMKTCSALVGMPLGINAPSMIATEYVKHDPQFMRGTPNPDHPREYCPHCGEVEPCNWKHLPNHK